MMVVIEKVIYSKLKYRILIGFRNNSKIVCDSCQYSVVYQSTISFDDDLCLEIKPIQSEPTNVIDIRSSNLRKFCQDTVKTCLF